MSSIAMAMFIGSVYSVLLSIKRRYSIQQQYTKILSKLFTQLPNIKYISSNSQEDILALRQAYFQSIMSESLRKVKVIHVAGSKGKGSTTEYIAAGLRGNGYTVGVFTSPHLHSARERIKINKTLISQLDIIRLGTNVIQEMESFEWLVFFDLFLAIAIKYFSEHTLDYMLLETGIGGRFDSTNFITHPIASVITSISLDHQMILGDTIEKIAWQKAGIIKSNGYAFTSANQKQSVLQVFQQEANLVSAHLTIVPINRNSTQGVSHIRYDVQVENLCLASAVLQHLGVQVNPHSMSSFFWPCRLEVFQVSRGVFGKVDVVIDGCHNQDSMSLFIRGLRQLYPTRELWLVFGCGYEKNSKEMLSEAMQADRVLLVKSSHFKSMGFAALEQEIDEDKRHRIMNYSLNPCLEDGTDGNVAVGLMSALNRRPENVVIAVGGSLFVAAEAREGVFRNFPELFAADDWVLEKD